MAESEVVTLEVDTSNVEAAIESIIETFGSLQSLAKDIGQEMAKAFAPMQKILQKTEMSIGKMTDALVDATTTMESFAAQISKIGGDAFADIVSSLSLIVDVTADWDKISEKITSIGTAIAAVFTNTGWLSGALKAIGKTLLSFVDEIAAALGISSGGVVAIVIAAVAAITAAVVAVVKNWDQITAFFTEQLPQAWAQFVSWLGNAAASIAETFSLIGQQISTFFGNLWNQLTTVFHGIGQWVQENVIQPVVDVFTPIAEWFSLLFGSIRQTVTDVFYNIGVIITGCWEIIQTAWGLAADWFETSVIQPIVQLFTGLWENVTNLVRNAWTEMQRILLTVGTWMKQYVIQPVSDFFAELWQSVANAAKIAWEGIKETFSKAAFFFSDVFSKAWAGIVQVFSTAGDIFTDIKDAVLTAFKRIVNAIISGINSVVRVPFNGINSALNSLRFTEVLGIYPFGRLGTIRVPQIPYLAQGAVLPANKPFLAVVGDQRHGTNIEAPLSTIQEAVAVVMEEHIAAMMAGFEALISEQRQTRHTIEGIQVGDSVIGQAVDRYRSKMAVVNGGFV